MTAGYFDSIEECRRLDAFEANEGRTGEIEVYRGAQSTRSYYWTQVGGEIVSAQRISDLPRPQLRSDAIAFYMSTMSQGAYEDRFTGQTVFRDVRKASAACITTIDRVTASSRQEAVFRPYAPYVGYPASTLASWLRELLVDTARRLIGDDDEIWLETSGGIDSTLMGAIARLAVPRKLKIHSISLSYPYYEFRRERSFIDCAVRWLASRPVLLDGSACLSFSSDEVPLAFSEPSLIIAGLAQHLAVLGAVGGRDGLLLNGNGGDGLFALGPLRQPGFDRAPERCEWMDDSFFADYAGHRSALARHCLAPDSASENFLSGGYIDDRWTERELAPALNVRRNHLFLHEEIPPIVHALWSQLEEHPCGKWILLRHFQDLIPEQILRRPQKVAYNGLYCRAYRAARDKMHALIDRYADYLEAAGIVRHVLQRHVSRLADGNSGGDLEVSVVITFLLWLEGWRRHGMALT
jgi:asparagine synthetase B (glutamine-hydrolysing)